MAALIRSARPGFGGLNQLLHLTIALDSLLVAPDDYANKQAARSYARRLACCLADPDNAPDQYEPVARLMYQVRSDLVHGRATKLDASSEELQWLTENGRAAAVRAVTLSAAWISKHSASAEALREAMDNAFASLEALASLHAPQFEVA